MDLDDILQKVKNWANMCRIIIFASSLLFLNSVKISKHLFQKYLLVNSFALWPIGVGHTMCVKLVTILHIIKRPPFVQYVRKFNQFGTGGLCRPGMWLIGVSPSCQNRDRKSNIFPLSYFLFFASLSVSMSVGEKCRVRNLNSFHPIQSGVPFQIFKRICVRLDLSYGLSAAKAVSLSLPFHHSGFLYDIYVVCIIYIWFRWDRLEKLNLEP